MKVAQFQKVFFVAAIVMLVSTAGVYAEGIEDFSIHILPGLEIPVGEKSTLFDENALFGLGASASIRGQYVFPSLPLLYLDGGLDYRYQPTQADLLNVIGVGLGTGVNFRIGNAMSLQAGAQAGWYLGFFPDIDPAGNPFFGGSLQFGWDFSPAFSLAAGTGYRYYLGYDSATEQYTDLVQGVQVSIGSVFRLSSATERTKVQVHDMRFDPVFPVFYGYYDDNSVGSVEVRNGENSPISDVKVFFNVNEYMEQPKLSAELPVLRRGESAEVDLKALFRNSVMQLTESTKVQAEIIAEYTYLGKRFSRKVPYTLKIYDRNSMTWDDDRKAACFVTPKDPTVLLFSKNTAGIIRDQGNSPVNLNLRIAMGIYEALRLYGMTYVIDPQSSYIEASANTQFLDYLQFPVQSLTFRAGDCDDLSILYSALLESVGIETAFITIPGHIYMAFSLGIGEAEAKKLFTNTNDFIFKDDNTWVPVEITQVSDGFMKSWRTGAMEWRDATGKGSEGFYKIREAWETYEPVAIPGNALSLIFPSTDGILARYDENLKEFVDGEIEGPLAKYYERIRSKGDTASIRNRVGVLYARYGRYSDAEQQFRLSVERDKQYVSPLVNLGNIYYLKGEIEKAYEWYEKAAELSPENQKVLVGLARTQYELEKFDEARADYDKLAVLNPSLASEYSYIGDQSGALGRASAAKDRGKTVWDDAEDE